MSRDASRVPVIVGVGQVNDRPQSPIEGLDPVQLMTAALRAADEDGGSVWLRRLDSLAVVAQISFPDLSSPSTRLAAQLGVAPRLCYETEIPGGDSPILLLNEAANRIAAGEIEVAAIVGGEALRTAAQRAALAAGDKPSEHNATREVSNRRPPSYRQRYGLTAPVDIYPLYENAGRAAYGQSLSEAQAESGKIWSLFSEVAAANSGAWIRKKSTAQEIITTSEGNRPIAFPYSKLMVANSSVNQGAGFIVTNLARALDSGVPETELVYIGRGVAAHEPSDILVRDRFDRSASMTVSLSRALELNGIEAADLDFVELYSCFPCIPKMARRVLGWPVDRAATVFGGLTFGGGPIGNYMSHAIVSMVGKLRNGGRMGLLFGNGGFATHNHTIVLSRAEFPPGTLPFDFNFQEEAEALRVPFPGFAEDYTGPGKIETFTVLYGRDGRVRFGVVVGRSPDGERFLAKVPGEDTRGIEFLISGHTEPVGTAGQAVRGSDDMILWIR